MKKNLYGVVFLASILLAACSQSRNMGSSYTDESSNSISYQQFYDDLNPYGQWINNPDFGYVWSPRTAGFRPYYSNGHWAYTNYGWTWVSNYNWGWATFHYGRWFYDNFYGWLWVPGDEWAPAWVSWRQNDNYYGWAPLCPRGRNGRDYQIQNDQWAFVPNQYIHRNDLNNYYINNQNNITIINNTTIINNPRIINNGAEYQEGPKVAEVEKITNTKIKAFQVKQSPVAGDTRLQRGELHMYKPAVKPNTIIANYGESRPGMPGKVMPSKQAPVTNQPAQTVITNDNTGQRLPGTNINNSTPGRTRRPVTVQGNQVNPGQSAQGSTPGNADEINTNNTSDYDRRQRESGEFQQRQNTNRRQNPVNVRPNTNVQQREVSRDENTNNNTVPPQRVFVTPPRNQEQAPSINRRPLQTSPNPPVDRSPAFERRLPPASPPPANVNKDNTGVRKF